MWRPTRSATAARVPAAVARRYGSALAADRDRRNCLPRARPARRYVARRPSHKPSCAGARLDVALPEKATRARRHRRQHLVRRPHVSAWAAARAVVAAAVGGVQE
eukprot:scaffold1127_cov361-Prasinococcus_capsulatus_cf.AAC.4